MEYINQTPYPSLAYDALDAQGNEFHVAVLRMTLDILPDGRLSPANEQSSLVMKDEFLGEPFTSSVKQESDLAPYKPWCDVILIGNAWAPRQKASKRFLAGIRITRKDETVLQKQVIVTGPRHWVKRFARGWVLTEPEPIQTLPLRYEYAFGGECRIDQQDPAASRVKKKHRLREYEREHHPAGPTLAPVAHTCCETNPIGQGFAEPWYLKAKKLTRVPAPQIEPPLEPIRRINTKYAPQGFGVIGRPWISRSSLCGTIDSRFIQSDKWLPEDFDFAYWNGAHPDMQCRWLEGGEVIDLINIQARKDLSERTDSQGNRIHRLVLPGNRFYGIGESAIQTLIRREFRIDTLVIDMNLNKVYLVYRLKLDTLPVMNQLEVSVLDQDEKAILDQHSEDAAQYIQSQKEVVHG